ncbi:tRNA 2'-phosphotransferase, partial [Ascochyta clinopodiicola]
MARTGGGSRNPANQPRSVQVSRKVSWLLRHGASSEGLQLGKSGYVSVAAALQTRALKSLGVTFEELRGVVKENEKQRFSMVRVGEEDKSTDAAADVEDEKESQGESQDPNDYLIRANQGHSLKVDTEGLLTSISAAADNVPKTVVHGTNERAWTLILKGGGLRRMTRTHIHFAAGLPKGFEPLASTNSSVSETAATDAEKEPPAPVISGMRSSSTILIYIDINRALAAGIPFSVSSNG